MGNNFEKEFEKLNHFEDGVDDFVWENITNRLDKKENKKRGLLLFLPLILVFSSIFIYQYLTNIKFNNNHHNVTQKTNEPFIKSETEINELQLLKSKEFQTNKKNHRLIFTTLNKANNLEESLITLITDKNEILNESSNFLTKMNLKSNPIEMTLDLINDVQVDKLNFQSKKTERNKNHFVEIFKGNSSLNTIGKSQDFGFSFGTKLSDRKSFSIGLAHQKQTFLAYHHHDKPYSFVYDSILAINDKREVFYFKKYDTIIQTSSQKFETEIMQIVLPISYRYQLLKVKKWSLDINAEAALSYQINKLQKINTTRGTKLLESKYDELYQYKSKWNASTKLGLRINYSLFKNHQLFLYPSAGLGISPIQNQLTTKKVNLKQVNLQFGYKFVF